MKNQMKLKAIGRIAGIIAFMVIIGFSFSACGEEDINMLLGTWEGTINQSVHTYTFNEDMTYTLTIAANQGVTFKGNYYLFYGATQKENTEVQISQKEPTEKTVKYAYTVEGNKLTFSDSFGKVGTLDKK